MHDIATGAKNVQQAREYYAEEFLNARRKQATPYMEKLRFMPAQGSAADPDTRMPYMGSPGFLSWLAGTLSLLSAVAIIWETIPMLWVPVCG